MHSYMRISSASLSLTLFPRAVQQPCESKLRAICLTFDCEARHSFGCVRVETNERERRIESRSQARTHTARAQRLILIQQ